MYWGIFLITLLASWLVSALFESRMRKYSAIHTSMTGREVAEKMLRENGIMDVRVVSTAGRLTDHYNPVDRTVNLSQDVYNGATLAAMAVAAHECGHAVQHARAYGPLTMRSQLVPIVSFASQWVTWVILAGIFLLEVFPTILFIGILMFAATTLFSFITLPVEIDASRRALAWLNNSGMTNYTNQAYAKDALKSAAYTYVVAALGSLATLIYYIMIFMGRSRD